MKKLGKFFGIIARDITMGVITNVAIGLIIHKMREGSRDRNIANAGQ